jgi:hypothetical protein
MLGVEEYETLGSYFQPNVSGRFTCIKDRVEKGFDLLTVFEP